MRVERLLYSLCRYDEFVQLLCMHKQWASCRPIS